MTPNDDDASLQSVFLALGNPDQNAAFRRWRGIPVDRRWCILAEANPRQSFEEKVAAAAARRQGFHSAFPARTESEGLSAYRQYLEASEALCGPLTEGLRNFEWEASYVARAAASGRIPVPREDWAGLRVVTPRYSPFIKLRVCCDPWRIEPMWMRRDRSNERCYVPGTLVFAIRDSGKLTGSQVALAVHHLVPILNGEDMNPALSSEDALKRRKEWGWPPFFDEVEKVVGFHLTDRDERDVKRQLLVSYPEMATPGAKPGNKTFLVPKDGRRAIKVLEKKVSA